MARALSSESVQHMELTIKLLKNVLNLRNVVEDFEFGCPSHDEQTLTSKVHP